MFNDWTGVYDAGIDEGLLFMTINGITNVASGGSQSTDGDDLNTVDYSPITTTEGELFACLLLYCVQQ